MKNTKSIYGFILIVAVLLLVTRCAVVRSPEGGEKDEEAPIFISADPAFESTDFKKQKIKLYFDELIKLKDLNKQLIVSPPLKTPALISPQTSPTEELTIEILDTLLDNTTYIFNFANAIEDNNEGNTLENFKYVFSTGTYIDSLTTYGSVKDALLPSPEKNVNILLYKIDTSFQDSTIYRTKPNYIANTRDTARFDFSNLKEGKYFLIALKESSSDYLFDPKTDKIGFLKDTVYLPRDSVITKKISLFKELLPYKFKRGKEASRGKIIVGFEGNASNMNIELLSDVPENFKSISRFEADKDTLNYWFTPVEKDSLNFLITNDTIIDTLTVKLRKKKIDSLVINPSINSLLEFRDTFSLKSNNPIIKIDTSKITFIDIDSLAVEFKNIMSTKQNTISFLFDKKPAQEYRIAVLPDAFIDIFEQANDSLSYYFKTREEDDYGKITLNVINPRSENVIIELLGGKKGEEIIDRKFISSTETLVFEYLNPGPYTIRAIFDSNNNQQWDTGSYLEKRLPENVQYFKTAIDLKANYYLVENFMLE